MSSLFYFILFIKNSLLFVGHAWFLRYTTACASVASQRVFSTEPLSYQSLLELDIRIRSYPVPSYLQPPSKDPENKESWPKDSVLAMQQFGTSWVRDLSKFIEPILLSRLAN